jgi:hypothetical protein
MKIFTIEHQYYTHDSDFRSTWLESEIVSYHLTKYKAEVALSNIDIKQINADTCKNSKIPSHYIGYVDAD